ncbi:MAG: flagellar motor protein MotB [Pseudomonadota bacterium]
MTAADKTPSPAVHGWLMSFGDLLGILLALFVMIHAASDASAVRLSGAIVSLTEGLVGEGQDDPADLNDPQRYTFALLSRNLEALPQWRISETESGNVTLQLQNWALENALGDGLWLESIERFKRPVWLTVSVADSADVTVAASAIAALKDMRASLGLTQPWQFSIRKVGKPTLTGVQIDIGVGDSDIGYWKTRSAKALSSELQS